MAYRAEIQIGVVGIGQLGALQKSLNQVATTVDIINKKRVDAGFNIQNINTYNATLQKAWQNINKAVMGSQEELQAVKALVTAKNSQIAAQQRLNFLIAKEEASRKKIVATADAGYGLQGPKAAPVSGGAGARRGIASPITGGRDFPGSPGARAAMFENLALGAGFPLLFGGGAGQVAGGLLGSFVGTGFGGQILGSAIGQQLEDAFRRVADIGKAAQELNLDNLRDSIIAVNADLDITVDRLVKAGQADAARAEVGKQIALQTGLLPETTDATAQAVGALSTAWNEVVGAVSGLLSILGRDFVTALTIIFQGVANVVKLLNLGLQLLQRFHPVLGPLNALWAKIEERLPNINEDQEKIKAEIENQTDAYSRQLGLSLKLEDIDKRRNKGNSIAAQINNNELDRQAKIAKLNEETDKKLNDARLKYRGQDISLLEQQIKAEAAIETRTINREAARKRENLEIQRGLEVLNNIMQVEKSRTELQQQLLSAEQNRLEQQLQLTTSLNEEAGVISRIAEVKRASANEELQAAYASAEASVRKAELENKNVETTREVAANTIATAEAKYRDLQATTALEEKQRLVAAYAKELALDTQRAAQAAAEHLSKVENSARRISSFADAYKTVNNVQKSILQTEFESTTNIERKREILDEIYKLDIANAKLTLASTKAQIAADIERQRILMENVRLEYEKARATTLFAAAQGVVNREHYAALDAAASALRIAENTYRTTQQVATYQTQAAEALYRGEIHAAKAAYQAGVLRVNTAGAAAAAGGFADQMQRGVSAFGTLEAMQNSLRTLGRKTVTTATYTAKEARALRIGPYARKGSLPVKLAKGGFVTKPTFAMIGEGGEPEFVVPQSKAGTFAQNWFNGARNAAALESSGSAAPVVQVTTGPVMQQNGQMYVTMQDFEQGLQTVANSILGNNRSAGGRRYAGLA